MKRYKICVIYYNKSTNTEYQISINECESSFVHINIRAKRTVRILIHGGNNSFTKISSGGYMHMH